MAARLIMVALILDGLDGLMARLLKGTTSFGAELDTFVDMTSFGLAPALLAHQAYWHSFGGWGLALASFMVLSGASRLSRFRLIDPFRGQQGFLGLPITCAGGFVTMAVFTAQSGVPEEWGWTWLDLSAGPTAWTVWIVVALMLALQISHVRYVKASKHPAVFISGIVLVIMLFIEIHVAVVAAVLLCLTALYFGLVSPFFHRPAEVPDAKPPETSAA
jgi:CDP-diacylglycerol--serine O-phosphatidyltransferase